MADRIETLATGEPDQQEESSAPRFPSKFLPDSRIGWRESLALAAALTILTAFSLLYAARQSFAGDEYLVLATARSGSATAVWHVLKTAPLSVDPPLYHFLIISWIRVFGPSEFSLRVPSALAYVLMTFLLYRFVRRYADAYTGFLVVSLCLQCGTFLYAYHARPYSLVLAADALALLSWSSLVEQHKRRLALVGLFLGISIAVGSHWFGCLVLIPLVFGEALRTWRDRRIDTPVWGAMTAGAATVLLYLPLLPAASKYKALPWKGVGLGDIGDSYRLVLDPSLFPLTLLVIALVVVRFAVHTRETKPAVSPIPMPVFACVTAFSLIPFPGFLVAKFLSNALEPRYVLLCTLGIVILASLAIRDAARPYALGMGLSILIIAGYGSFSHYRELSGTPAGGDTAKYANVVALSAEPDLPVVPSDDDLFLRLEAHAPAAVRARCVFPADESSIRILGQNTNFLMTEALRQWTTLPVEDLSLFLQAHPKFYLIQRAGDRGWLIQWLMENHAGLTLDGTYGGNPVYRVQAPLTATTSK